MALQFAALPAALAQGAVLTVAVASGGNFVCTVGNTTGSSADFLTALWQLEFSLGCTTPATL